MGSWVGPASIERVQDIIDAKDVDVLSKLVRARFHPLTENLRGFHALDLAGRWRLIVSLHDEGIMIEEVSNHYDQ